MPRLKPRTSKQNNSNVSTLHVFTSIYGIEKVQTTSWTLRSSVKHDSLQKIIDSVSFSGWNFSLIVIKCITFLLCDSSMVSYHFLYITSSLQHIMKRSEPWIIEIIDGFHKTKNWESMCALTPILFSAAILYDLCQLLWYSAAAIHLINGTVFWMGCLPLRVTM